jgi:hypothetical protein
MLTNFANKTTQFIQYGKLGMDLFKVSFLQLMMQTILLLLPTRPWRVAKSETVDPLQHSPLP